MLTVRVPERDRNKCERVTGPQPERVGSIFAGVNATRTSGTGPERDRNANRIRCEHGLSACCIGCVLEVKHCRLSGFIAYFY